MIVAAVLMALRFGLALLFGASAVAKLRDRRRWTEMLSAYRLLPDGFVGPVAVLLPVAEIAVAVGLVLGVRLAGLAGAVLMLVFAAAMAVNLYHGRTALDCGCNPAARPQRISSALVVRNIVLAGALLACAVPVAALPLEFAGIAAFAGTLFYLLFHVISMLRAFAPATTPEPR